MTRIKTAWRTARDGTKRTAGWATGGVRDNVRSLFTRTPRESGPPSDDSAPKPAAAANSDEAPGVPGRGRKIAIFAAAGLVLTIWIGWTAYVWNENGSTAGIGVLISWPAVFAALALVAAPFVGAGMFVRRQRTAGEADLAAPETATVEPEPKAAESPDTSDPAPTTASQPGTPHAASPHHRSPVGSLSEAEDVPADGEAEDSEESDDAEEEAEEEEAEDAEDGAAA